MSVTGITANPSLLAGVSSGAGTTSTGRTSKDDFLKLLTTQLRYQNPLDPVNDSQFVSQMSQISTVEGIQQLNANVSELLLMQGMSQGANLIGKRISYDQDGKGTIAQGTVQSIQITAGKINLQVAGKPVPLGRVQGIAN